MSVSPSLIEPECVSAVFDNEDFFQERSEFKLSRLEAHYQLNFHIYGTSLSPSWPNLQLRIGIILVMRTLNVPLKDLMKIKFICHPYGVTL
jgi:hypothetical protein